MVDFWTARHFRYRCLAAAALIVGVSAPAIAAELPVEQPNTDYNALPFGGWMLYPSITAGAVYDDNIHQSAVNRVSGWGARVTPSLVADYNAGIHHATFYGSLDGRFYFNEHNTPGLDNNNAADSLSARIGATHVWAPLPDLTVRMQGDYTRQTDIFNNGTSLFNINNVNIGSVTGPGIATIIQNPSGMTPTADPTVYNQFTGSMSAQKDLNRAFVGVGGSVSHIAYDTNGLGLVGPVLAPVSRDGTVYTITGRGGYWLTPFLYAFAQTSADTRRFETSIFDSNGYRVTGGLGSDQIGLFRGEVYGGYQEQRHDNGPLDTASSAVFGGRVVYLPAPYWTFTGSVDQTLGVSLVSTPTSPLGTDTRVTVALLQTNYALAQFWAAAARVGYTRSEYLGSIRTDDAWLAGVTLSYTFWRNMGLTLDYQYMQVDSTVALASVRRNMVTLGVTYRY